MISEQRKIAEEGILLQYLPQKAFKFIGLGTNDPAIVMAAMTNAGNQYVLVIKLRNFPESVPDAYVNGCLYDCLGDPLTESDGQMHTLCYGDGKTHICHYGKQSWTSNVSLYKIYLKCRLWLECYELHMETGMVIDHYLKHQQ